MVRAQSFFLFFLALAISSCSGQTKTESNQQSSLSGQPEIVLPEGVSEHTMFRCSMKDKAGNIWFGTTGAGIYKYDGKQFTRYAEKEGLLSTLVYSIAQDSKGSIWVGTDDGVYYSRGDSFSRLTVPAPENSGNSFPIISSSGKKLTVYCVLSDSKGNIWFGTEDQGLWRYDGTSFRNFRCADSIWEEVQVDQIAAHPQKGFVQYLLEDRNGNIWISSFATNLDWYDGKSFHHIDVSQLSTAHFFGMTEDQAGNIWMASRDDGICRYDGKAIKAFTEKDGVDDNSASCVYRAKDGRIFFGSLGKSGTNGTGQKGIGFYDGKTFTLIPSTGLRNNEVWTVIEDNAGNIWVGTKEFGLFRYDGQTFTEVTKQ